MKIFCAPLLAIFFYQSSFAQTEIVPPPPPRQDNIQHATFTSSEQTWKRYLEKNLNAHVASDAKVLPGTYTVKVEFNVSADGNVSNVKAVSGPPLCKPCGVEAIRVVESSPKWTPAMRNGEPVSEKMTQFISFGSSFDSLYEMLAKAPILVRFENLSLTEAILKAGNTGKIVFAQFVSDKCDQCNETADMAMKSARLAAAVNGKCIPIKIDFNYIDRKEFIDTYNPNEYIGTYFISGDEDLLSRFAKTTSNALEYIAEIDKAIAKQTEGRVTMKELDEEWQSNPVNFLAMEMNLQKRLAIGWKTDSLLDVYARRLPADSSSSKRVLKVIAMQAPSIFSFANGVLRHDQSLFNQVWYEMPLAARIGINRIIINRSLHKAVELKNKDMAERVARFAAGIYPSDTIIPARHDYDLQWLNYYKGVRDTAAALSKAITFYDTYVMTINPRDVHLRDSINRQRALDTAHVEEIEDPTNKGHFIQKRSVSYRPFAASFAAELIQGASLIYNSSNNPAYLQRAIAWAKRSREFNNFTDIQNTYAKLLYVNGNKAEAIALEKETIQKPTAGGQKPPKFLRLSYCKWKPIKS